MNNVEDLRKSLLRAETNHFNASISDNFYYTSGRNARAKKEIEALKKRITALEAKEAV